MKIEGKIGRKMKKTRGKGIEGDGKKRVGIRLSEHQRKWLRLRPEKQATLVRTAIDVLKNWFSIDPISGNVTPKSIVARQFSDRVFKKEWKRRFEDE